MPTPASNPLPVPRLKEVPVAYGDRDFLLDKNKLGENQMILAQ